MLFFWHKIKSRNDGAREKLKGGLRQPEHSGCPTVWEAMLGVRSAHHLNCVALRAPPRHSVPCPLGVLIRCAPEMDDSKAQYENRLCEEGWRTACANIVCTTHTNLCFVYHTIWSHTDALYIQRILSTRESIKHRFPPKQEKIIKSCKLYITLNIQYVTF